jgi:23S rRNA (cytidine1920-2'-O)/16S rRNA (cytidine1409-2'-O)-methyltransferase
VPSRRPPPFVPLITLVGARFPDLEDPERAIRDQRVLVDGRVIANPRARARRDARIRLLEVRRLRGDVKLSAALDAFRFDVTGLAALDLGAAAGGFTTALLQRGAARVYAVDAGYGQLAGVLRADPRVVNLERTNVATLDRRTVPDRIDVVTMDLSYTSIAAAVGSLDALALSTRAVLIALVKPTFELRAAALVIEPRHVRAATQIALQAIESHAWRGRAITLPAVTGRRGAIEAFVLADRRGAP